MTIRDTSGQDRSITKPNFNRLNILVTTLGFIAVFAAIIYAWSSVSRILQADYTVSQQNLRFATVVFGIYKVMLPYRERLLRRIALLCLRRRRVH